MSEWAEWVEFCEASGNSLSKSCWKFPLFILKNKKVLFLKKISSKPSLYIGQASSSAIQQMALWRPNFPERFWCSPHVFSEIRISKFSIFLDPSESFLHCLLIGQKIRILVFEIRIWWIHMVNGIQVVMERKFLD